MSKIIENQVARCRKCNKHKEAMSLFETAPNKLLERYWELNCSLCLLKQYICGGVEEKRMVRDDSVEIYAAFLDAELRADKWKFATIALSIILVVVILGMGHNA